MDNIAYQKFLKILENENKDEAVRFVLSLLTDSSVSLDMLYQNFLIPALQNFTCKVEDEKICIWKEHIRSSIIRTLLECTYPHLIREKQKETPLNKKVIVVCPQEEYHEIGAIITSHYFNLAGFDSMFIGANTPNEQIITAVKAFEPDYLAISVTNYYNLVATKIVTESLSLTNPDLRIIVGGQAFSTKGALNTVKHHYHFQSKDDVFRLAAEVRNEGRI